MCSRCNTAKMMLDKRRPLLEQQGVTIEYIDLTVNLTEELPQLFIDDKVYYGKDALLKIRELSPIPLSNI